MFDLKLTVPETDANDSLDATIFEKTAEHVRKWLQSDPDPAALATNLPALELALAAYVKNRDHQLLASALGALARFDRDTNFERLAGETLAALILLNLRAFQIVEEMSFRDAAQEAIQIARARYDKEREFFKTRAGEANDFFWTYANARLAEAFYFTWRALGDQPLRPIAGAVLGHVGALYDPAAGLYQRAELPDGARTETKDLAAYAAAMEMFLTATETTGRRTYLSRARILADYALEFLNREIGQGAAAEQIAFAEALIRLEQFTSEAEYRAAAMHLLKAISPAASKGDAALALAVEHALHFPLHLVLIGDVERDENAQAMWQFALTVYASARALEALDPERHAARIRQLGYAASASGTIAYLCIGPMCLPPVHSPQEIEQAIQWAQNVQHD